MFLFARYIESGVFEVLDIPSITTSACLRPLGSLPSSYFTANSMASTLLKYALLSFLITPASRLGCIPNLSEIAVRVSPIMSMHGIECSSENLFIISMSSSSTSVYIRIELQFFASSRIGISVSSSSTYERFLIS